VGYLWLNGLNGFVSPCKCMQLNEHFNAYNMALVKYLLFELPTHPLKHIAYEIM